MGAPSNEAASEAISDAASKTTSVATTTLHTPTDVTAHDGDATAQRPGAESGDALDGETSGAGAVISMTRLYRLWEENQWSAYAIDFAQDLRDWQDRLTPAQRRAASWNYSLFLHGEEVVARTLAPFVEASLTEEQRVFITTQIVDEARHHVFFSRFMREVVGVRGNAETEDTAVSPMSATLDAVRPELTEGFRQVFGALDRLTNRLRHNPHDHTLLAQNIALYHLVVEGMLAHPGQHMIREYTARLGVLPGLAEGMTHIARDESRHMAFGIQALSDLVAESEVTRFAVIRLFNRVLPWTLALFIAPQLGDAATRPFGWELEDLYAFGLRSFNAKITRAGITPGEVSALVKIGGGGAATPHEQARRALALLRAGVFGNVAPLRVDETILALLFDGLEQVVNMRPAARFPGTIQWEFDDAPPWRLVAEGEHVYARQGRADNPTLTLRCGAHDWAQIAGGKRDARLAVLSGRLRVSGDPWVALRLPSILGD